MAGHVAHMERMRNVYKVLVVKFEGKSVLGRSKHRWISNINNGA